MADKPARRAPINVSTSYQEPGPNYAYGQINRHAAQQRTQAQSLRDTQLPMPNVIKDVEDTPENRTTLAKYKADAIKIIRSDHIIQNNPRNLSESVSLVSGVADRWVQKVMSDVRRGWDSSRRDTPNMDGTTIDEIIPRGVGGWGTEARRAAATLAEINKKLTQWGMLEGPQPSRQEQVNEQFRQQTGTFTFNMKLNAMRELSELADDDEALEKRLADKDWSNRIERILKSITEEEQAAIIQQLSTARR